ncbi:MAG: hypothetical protein E5V62_07595 [Mesorhizobium sp.]|uniref:hypothetical protein n=1 Tax=Mesorhizobium sp. TaxID=1871066 RepID=UPI000FD35B6D|nr:hypothetical protein [Mesorhizobium sp.]RVD73342.1 hypothetical protein EN751_05380 [Mesorhizobium sp. M4A.F.Ca.ET.029.04.2.1]TIW36211.1 MAG: hypothetical protein E5V62_07595 [Mesorhizobium sp.]
MPNIHVPAAGEVMPAAEGIHIVGRFSGRLQPLGMPRGMDPREWRQSVEKRLNDLLDRAMSLVTALDLMQADCDLEDGADAEPSLGWSNGGGASAMSWPSDGRASHYDDRERDDADAEDDGSAEPSLGAPERHPASRDVDPLSGLKLPRSGFLYHQPGKSQERWADGCHTDREEDAGEMPEQPDHD